MAYKDGNKPVYTIGIAAGILDIHPQTLRMYERLGFIAPHRTKGKTRLYSEKNIERIRFIKELTRRKGVNLAGVELILNLQNQIEQLRMETEDLFGRLRTEMESQTREEDREERNKSASLSPVIRIKVQKG